MGGDAAAGGGGLFRNCCRQRRDIPSNGGREGHCGQRGPKGSWTDENCMRPHGGDGKAETKQEKDSAIIDQQLSVVVHELQKEIRHNTSSSFKSPKKLYKKLMTKICI